MWVGPLPRRPSLPCPGMPCRRRPRRAALRPDAPPSLNLTSAVSIIPTIGTKLPPTTPSYPYTGFKLEATQVVDQQSGGPSFRKSRWGKRLSIRMGYSRVFHCVSHHKTWGI